MNDKIKNKRRMSAMPLAIGGIDIVMKIFFG
jgi:hypothetical protein